MQHWCSDPGVASGCSAGNSKVCVCVCVCVCVSLYLHEDFEPVERSGERSGNDSSSSTGDQMSPPHPRHVLLGGKLIWDHHVLSHIEDLQTDGSQTWLKTTDNKRISQALFSVNTATL